jgi:hypothetical protein
MTFRNKQEECDLAEINTKGYCNWGVRTYGGWRRCEHAHYMHLKMALWCPYYWRNRAKTNDSEEAS